MNKYILFVLPLSVLAAACAPQHKIAADGECSTVAIPMNCNGSYSNPKLGITLVVDGIKIGPPRLCAHPGTEIQVTIQPPQTETGTVKTVPKDPANDWIYGTNETELSSFILQVPEDIEEKTNFDYTIIRSNGVCLDPRFEVDPNG